MKQVWETEKTIILKKKWEFCLAISVCLAIAIVLNFRMVRDGLHGMGDLAYHSMWMNYFAKQLAEGIWYPRWLAGTNYGYGSPTFVFYPPLPHYLGSFLKFCGLNFEEAIIALFIITSLLSGFNFYLYARQRCNVIGSAVGAISYASAPYFAFNTYSVASISVAFGIAWIPLGFWLTERAMSDRKWSIGLALAWTMLALIHLPSLLLYFLVLMPYTLLFLLWQPWQIVVNNIIAIGLGLGIASFFLIPAIFEQSFVDINFHQGVLGGGFQNMMFGSKGLPLFPIKIDFSLTRILYQQLGNIAIFSLFIFLFFRKNREAFDRAKYWLIFLLFLGFMMTSWSYPIWSTTSTLLKVQAPWRLFPIFTFGTSILATIALSQINNINLLKKTTIVLLTCVIFTANFSFFYQLSRQLPTFRNPGRANLDHLEATRQALFGEYTENFRDAPEHRPLQKDGLPSPRPLKNQPRFSVIEGKASVDSIEWQSYRRMFKITAETATKIKIRTYNYPAWHLYINERDYPYDIAEDGTIEFALTAGSYSAKLIYEWTPALIVGTIVSLGCCLLLSLRCFFLFFYKRKLLFRN